MSAYLDIDGMQFPDPRDPLSVEWSLRYGEPSREQLLVAASFVAAYKQLVGVDSQRTRNRKIEAVRLRLLAARYGVPLPEVPR